MRDELARWLVRPLIDQHPLPWHLEVDWTAEVTDAAGTVVIKLPSAHLAEELIAFAHALSKQDADAAASLREILPDFEL